VIVAHPSVSVVIPTRERPELLRDAVASVAAQRPAPLDVRIADDGERPLSPDFASLGPPPVVVIRVGAGLLAGARNRGSAGAPGDVLAFLDDDDRWLPGHLDGLAGAFADPAVDVAWRDCAVIRERLEADGTRRELERRVIAQDWDMALMRTDDYLPPSAWAVRRSFFDRLGGFDESFPFSEDWDFLMRAAALTTPRRVPGITVEVRMRDRGNLSTDFGPARLECLCKLSARHGLPPLVPKTFWEVAERVNAPRSPAVPRS
jgi:glycosyltransferase involved in cell wall biosynthesis